MRKNRWNWRWWHLEASFCDKELMFSGLQLHFTCLLFADAHSWDNLSHWDTECHRKVCVFKGTERWLQLIVIVWVSLNSQLHELKTEEGPKVVVFLPLSVWFSAIHNQEIQQPLYLKKIYIWINFYSAFFFCSCSTRCLRSSAISIRCFLHARLVQREFSWAFDINKMFLKAL